MLQPASLFIGRWAPFHEGHRALIETVLRTGKPVVIAIRDTEPSTDNPYSTSERWTTIQEALREWGSLVRIIVIPEIDEVCYGRDVGYGVRRIELTDELHQISATEQRKAGRLTYPIIWLTGQSGSGKTTLAHALKSLIGNALVLDGNEMRESISTEGFSRDDRHVHNLRVARLAHVLSKQSIVIVSVIAPFADTRGEISRLVAPSWVYCVRREQKSGSDYPYEPPDHSEITVMADGDFASATENAAEVLRAMPALSAAGASTGTLTSA
jgi:hypothetical protein